MEVKNATPDEIYSLDDITSPESTDVLGLIVKGKLVLCSPRTVQNILDAKKLFSDVSALLCRWDNDDCTESYQGYVITAFEDDVLDARTIF